MTQPPFSPCISLDGPKAINTCDERKSFTIRWSGGGSTQLVTYRINEDSERAIYKRNQQGVIVSEGAFEDVTNNPEVDLVLEVEQGSPDQKMFRVSNPHDHYVALFLEVEVWRNDQLQYTCSRTRLIKPRGWTRACVFNNDDRTVTKKFRGEQDPD